MYRPGERSVTRWAWASGQAAACRARRDSGQAGGGGREMLGPGCRPRTRKNLAVPGASCAYDQEKTARTLTAGSPVSSAVSPLRASRNSAASAAMVNIGVGGGPGGGDGQGQRQAPAHRGYLGDRAGVGGGPVGTEPGGQHGPGVRAGEHVEGEQVGAFGDGQPGELVTAGDQHQAAGRAGQQRADLLLVEGVIQHDQQSPARRPRCGTARPGRSSRSGSARGVTPSASRNPRITSPGGGRTA